MLPNFHFLVVDDLPTVRYFVVALLKTLGYTTVSQAENGEQAIERIRCADVSATPINFILTDWNMPIMDGLTLLRTIRACAEWQHLPILMVTAEAETVNIAAAGQAGADGYLAKRSLNAPLLKEALDGILMQRGLQGEVNAQGSSE